MKKILAAIVAVFAVGFIGSSASAQCVWVSCPNSPPPAPQVHYQSNSYTVQSGPSVSYRENVNDGYEQGYRDGVRASSSRQRTPHRATTRTTSRSTAHATTTRRHHSTAVARTSSANNRTAARTRTATATRYSAPARRTASATRTRTSVVRTNQVATRTNYSQTSYVQPYRNHAATYNAPQYGNSINVASYGGRGESWVSTRTQVVRYAAPHVISNIGGQSCGWGAQLAPNGHSTGRQAFVCHCADGWQPR